MIEKISKDTLENFTSILKGHIPFTTGFNDLDSFLAEMNTKGVIVIGSRPSVGKTMFTISIINHLLTLNKKVCYFNLEGTREQVYLRLLSGLTKIDMRKLHDSFTNQFTQSSPINQAIETLFDKELYIKNKTLLSTEELEQDIKTVKPDIVVIDYIQLLKMPKASNLSDATDLVIQEIKRIAEENNIIIFLISQLSRLLELRKNKTPILSDLRNGCLLEELSDVILLIHRDGYYNCNINEKLRDTADIIVAKNKYGETGCFNLKYKNGLFMDYSIYKMIYL